MEKTSVRLPPEIGRRLKAEARELSSAKGEKVTVSDLLRACVAEKFPQVLARARRESAAICELQNEVARLSQRHADLSQNVQDLVTTLSEVVPKLATHDQVNELTDGLVETIRALKGT